MRNFFISYKNPLTVVIALIIMGGAYVYTKLQTSLFPEITFPKIKIIADAGLQPVNKMMITVTQPLEAAIKQVPELEDVRRITSRGSCEISAFMNWNANIDLSQQRIESRIAQIRNTLPPDVNITVEKMNPSSLPVIGYALEAANASMRALPVRLRRNRYSGKVDDTLPDVDYSIGTFEGIRSQDITPLLFDHLDPVHLFRRNCFLWRLVDQTYNSNYDMQAEEDIACLQALVRAELAHFEGGGRPTELHAVFRKPGA